MLSSIATVYDPLKFASPLLLLVREINEEPYKVKKKKKCALVGESSGQNSIQQFTSCRNPESLIRAKKTREMEKWPKVQREEVLEDLLESEKRSTKRR